LANAVVSPGSTILSIMYLNVIIGGDAQHGHSGWSGYGWA